MNPENGVFGVAKDTNEKTNPTALEAIKPGTGAIFTNIAYNAKTHATWFEGRTPLELLGGVHFPRVGELPYLLTLPGHGFYWFQLATVEE